MQGNSQGARMAFLPLGGAPVLNHISFQSGNAASQAQDAVQRITLENAAASRLDSRAVDTAALIAKNTAG
jgi:hypothetical protein